MKHLSFFILAMACLSASGQITYPYNPDGDANGLIGVTDLQDLLSTYGGAFAPGAIVVDSVELGEVLDSLQSQIVALQNESGDGFRCGDDVLHEGYWYNTTSIGGQCWFAENLRYLPEVSPSAEGSDLNPHAYVYGYEGVEVLDAKNTLEYHQFGVLYNFPAVEQWDLCPIGWHVSTDLEWTEMTSSLGSELFVANLMKTSYPIIEDPIYVTTASNWEGTNLSGFSGLPGGWRLDGIFNSAGSVGYWWSPSPVGSSPLVRNLYGFSEGVGFFSSNGRFGFSVRCVRDAE